MSIRTKKNIKFACLYLYLIMIAGIFAWYLISKELTWDILIALLGIMLVSQVILIFGLGLRFPDQRQAWYRLLLPSIAGSFFLSIISFGLLLALQEWLQFELNWGDDPLLFQWPVLIIWVFWSTIAFFYFYFHSSYESHRGIAIFSIGYSVISFAVCAFAHQEMETREGCAMGLFTGIGMFLSLWALVWAFGPAIVVLFLREKLNKERERQIDKM